jgi:hypothetical protein
VFRRGDDDRRFAAAQPRADIVGHGVAQEFDVLVQLHDVVAAAGLLEKVRPVWRRIRASLLLEESAVAAR